MKKNLLLALLVVAIIAFVIARAARNETVQPVATDSTKSEFQNTGSGGELHSTDATGSIIVASSDSSSTSQSQKTLSNSGSVSSGPKIDDALDTMTDQALLSFLMKTADEEKNVLLKTESQPASAKVIAQGNFVTRVEETSGIAKLLSNGDRILLRFETIATKNGSNLHVGLASGLTLKDIVDLGPLTVTSGSANYAVPVGKDVSNLRTAIIWSATYHVIFAYAEMK